MDGVAGSSTDQNRCNNVSRDGFNVIDKELDEAKLSFDEELATVPTKTQPRYVSNADGKLSECMIFEQGRIK